MAREARLTELTVLLIIFILFLIQEVLLSPFWDLVGEKGVTLMELGLIFSDAWSVFFL